MCKKVLKSHYIVTLQSKTKNNNFKAEVKFTKLKMKIIKNADYLSKKGILITPLHFTVSAVIQIHL